MTQRSSQSLAMLARLRRDEEEAAARRLRSAQEQLAVSTARLEALGRSVADYRAGHAAGAVSQWRQLRDGQSFLLELEFALESLRAAIEQERQNVEQARAHWLASRLRRVALDKLIDRREAIEATERRRSEQRQADDHAVRARSRANGG